MRITALFLLLLSALLAGCSSVNARSLLPKADLGKFRHLYVETAANDSAQLDAILAAELRRLGYDATHGVRTMRPDNAELIINYEGRWEWDFRQYLIEVAIIVRDARSGQMIATTREFHPGITGKAPAAMVHDALAQLFQPVAK